MTTIRKCATCRHAEKVPDRDPRTGLVTYRVICFCRESDDWMDYTEMWHRCDCWEEPEDEDDV
jgi:hypothetical protein